MLDFPKPSSLLKPVCVHMCVCVCVLGALTKTMHAAMSPWSKRGHIYTHTPLRERGCACDLRLLCVRSISLRKRDKHCITHNHTFAGTNNTHWFIAHFIITLSCCIQLFCPDMFVTMQIFSICGSWELKKDLIWLAMR